MTKRVCDFCGREVNDGELYIGTDCATPLKITIGDSDDALDVCTGCCWKIKRICKNKELLLGNRECLNKSEDKNNDVWCDTCEYKNSNPEVTCVGCTMYDMYGNIIGLRHYKKESEDNE